MATLAVTGSLSSGTARAERIRSQGLCIVAYVFYAASTLLWVRENQSPPSWDPSDHLVTSLQFFRAAQEGLEPFAAEFFHRSHVYAPLYHLAVAGFLLLIPQPLEAALYVNLALLALLMASTYGIGIRTCGPTTGIWAAVILPAFPIVAWLLHDGFIEFMLITAVACSFYAYLRTDGLRSRGWSVLFGVSLGLGGLTKQTFVFFLWLPVIVSAWHALKDRDRLRLSHLGLALLAAAGLAAVWYVPHLQDTVAIFQVNRNNAIEQGHPPTLSLLSFLAYPYFLLNYQLQAPFFVLFAFGACYAWRRQRNGTLHLFLLLAGAYFSLTLLSNKNPRYTAPMLAIVAVLSVAWMNRRSNDWRSLAVKGALVLLCAASFLQTQWPPTGGSGIYVGSSDRRGPRLVFMGHNLLRFDHRPERPGWPVERIFGDLRAQGPSYGRPIRIGITSNLPFFNPSNFRYYAETAATFEPKEPRVEVTYLLAESTIAYLNSVDFLVARSASGPLVEPTATERALTRNPKMLVGFQLWREYPLPDGSTAQVYRSHR
ncbi:MAG: glycosyltransferase family 39 protein [Acidobacteria bacterium]|nr:glycosyltransferase family 39 protein [Acidobacteriota bacterium]